MIRGVRHFSIISKLRESHLNWKLNKIEDEFCQSAEHSNKDRIKQHESSYTAKRALAKLGASGDREMEMMLSDSIQNMKNHDAQYEAGVQTAVCDILFNPKRAIGIKVFETLPDRSTSQTDQTFSIFDQIKQPNPVWNPKSLSQIGCTYHVESPNSSDGNREPQSEKCHEIGKGVIVAEYSDEWRRLQESRLRKVLEERKVQWLKMERLPNPVKAGLIL